MPRLAFDPEQLTGLPEQLTPVPAVIDGLEQRAAFELIDQLRNIPREITTWADRWASGKRGRRWITAVNNLGAVGIVNCSCGADAIDRVICIARMALIVSTDIQVALKIHILK